MSKKKKDKKLFKVTGIIWIITILILVLFTYTMLSINMIPDKYLLPGFITILAIHLIYLLCIKKINILYYLLFLFII